MIEVAASVLLFALTFYVFAAARLLWQQGLRAVVDVDEDRYVSVDGANSSWRAISDGDELRWSPPMYQEPAMPDDEVSDVPIDLRRFQSVDAVLSREIPRRQEAAVAKQAAG